MTMPWPAFELTEQDIRNHWALHEQLPDMTATNVRSQQKLHIALWGMDGFQRWLNINYVRNNQTSDNCKGALGTFWGVESCKAYSAYVRVPVMSHKVNIIYVSLSEVQNLGLDVAKFGLRGKK